MHAFRSRFEKIKTSFVIRFPLSPEKKHENLVPPKWIVEPEDQSVILGNSVTIPCEANGSPSPTLLWKQAIGKRQ